MNSNIKIISGWSNTGGSTEAFINLTNSLNNIGYNTTFYGPHDYHLNKCKSDKLNNIKCEKDDVLICHFLHLSTRPLVKRVILSCHEKNIFNLKNITKYWDHVVFLNIKQQQYHEYDDSYTIIPNIKTQLIAIDKSDKTNIAGIIGTIDENKQTHASIIRALRDNCEKIYLFGKITDLSYYNIYVKPLIDANLNRIVYMGHIEQKQDMYNMIGKVYLSSKSEVASLVKDECNSTNTTFYGSSATDSPVSTLTNDEILKLWISIIGV